MGKDTQSLPAPPVTAPAAQAAKVELAGRVYAGTKVYNSAGVFLGKVINPGEEIVSVSAPDGQMIFINRSAIRQGNTYFTDP